MSIRPVDMNGMIQTTQDISNMKQSQDNKPLVQQYNIEVGQQKQEDNLSHKVQEPEQKENEGYRYDAKEKGNNSYNGNGKKKKKQNQESEDNGKVVLRGTKSSFDVKI